MLKIYLIHPICKGKKRERGKIKETDFITWCPLIIKNLIWPLSTAVLNEPSQSGPCFSISFSLAK